MVDGLLGCNTLPCKDFLMPLSIPKTIAVCHPAVVKELRQIGG